MIITEPKIEITKRNRGKVKKKSPIFKLSINSSLLRAQRVDPPTNILACFSMITWLTPSERFYGFSPLVKHWIVKPDGLSFVQASLCDVISCLAALAQVKTYSLEDAWCSNWFSNQSASIFCQEAFTTKYRIHSGCYRSQPWNLQRQQNHIPAQSRCWETKFLREQTVSGKLVFNHW